LILDPPRGLLRPTLKENLRSPSESFDDQRIITVAAAYPIGVLSQLHLSDCFGEVYQFVAAKVDRLLSLLSKMRRLPVIQSSTSMNHLPGEKNLSGLLLPLSCVQRKDLF
jgi:hypothetical protein